MTEDKVKVKIIELCALQKIVEAEEEMGLPYEVSLADVLRAIHNNDWMVDSFGRFHKYVGYGEIDGTEAYPKWNLLEHYDNQTQKVKDFIGTLIGVV